MDLDSFHRDFMRFKPMLEEALKQWERRGAALAQQEQETPEDRDARLAEELKATSERNEAAARAANEAGGVPHPGDAPKQEKAQEKAQA